MPRESGILLPVTSLPSPHGIGTLGLPAYDFAGFLAEAGQRFWQVLPLGPTGWGDSPYKSYSSFAGNPYLIDLDTLAHMGYLLREEIDSASLETDPARVDYGRQYAARPRLLRAAFSRITPAARRELDAFFEARQSWLPDYALYMALREKSGGRPWYAWDAGLRLREASAIAAARAALSEEILFHGFVQMLFFTQWEQLRFYLKERHIRVIGDVPIYVPYDSADAWAHWDLFLTDSQRRPSAVSGVPPDYFSKDGQLWGTPLYDWDAMKKDDYAWWRARMAAQAGLFDAVRIDHFRALASFWAVPAGDASAKNGRWMPGPGLELVETLKAACPNTDLIAEDLGLLTDDVRALLRDSGLPGMKVLQFAFSPGANSDYLPHNHIRRCVLYAGTHDNTTTEAWFAQRNDEVDFARAYLGAEGADAFLRAGMASVADLFVSTMQDWLHLGAEARMNTPSVPEGNWVWRMRPGDASPALAEKIRAMTRMYARLGTDGDADGNGDGNAFGAPPQTPPEGR